MICPCGAICKERVATWKGLDMQYQCCPSCGRMGCFDIPALDMRDEQAFAYFAKHKEGSVPEWMKEDFALHAAQVSHAN